MTIKYVIIGRQQMSGRYAAIRGLSFATEEEAKQHVATKMHAYMQNRVHIEKRTVKDVDASQTMHCQCCGRAIHAALGKIAHHGYTRPGYGWQTPSCFGAKRLPWEADRSAVKDLIDHLKETLLRSEYSAMAVSDEIEPVQHWYQVYDTKVRGGYRTKLLELTRATFDDIVKANVDNLFKYNIPAATFDQFKTRDLAKRRRDIDQLKRDIKEFTAKYAGWKQTHQWNGKMWEAI